MGLNRLVTWRILNEEQLDSIIVNKSILIRGSHSDDRDEFVQRKMSSNQDIIVLSYDTENVKVIISFSQFGTGMSQPSIEDPVLMCDKVSEIIHSLSCIVILDITSLASELVFMLLKSFKECSIDNVYAVYVQPLEYIVERDAVLIPNYILSDARSSISSIPGFLVLPNDLQSLLIVFLGFEGGRFHELREHIQTDGNTEICPILPLPSYSAGWHMRTLYSNLSTLKESEVIQEIKRVTSWDPFHAFNMLEQIYNDSSESYQINVAPLGTKPHTLAAALFAIKHDDVRVMYDHPKVSVHRSIGVGPVRGYNLKGLI